MSFNSFSSNVKLNNIKAYSGVCNSNNKAFKNIFYSDMQEIDYSKYQEVDYNVIDLEKGIQDVKDKASEQTWYKTLYDYTLTISSSYCWGILEVVENVGDGLIMAGGAIASGVVGIWDEELSDEIKKGTQEVIEYDWTEAGYNFSMDLAGVNDEISQGLAHTISGGLGTAVGYVALSFVPGGTVVTTTAGALSAGGSASEHAFKSGATFEEALITSTVSAVAGAASGYGLDKIGKAAQGAKSLSQVAKYAGSGAAVAMSEPIVNSATEYITYGNDMIDENCNRVYENFGEYYTESGGLLNTVIAGGVGTVSTGIQGLSGYKNNQKRYSTSKSTVSEFSDSDVVALLQDAQTSDYYSKWKKRDLSSWAHQNFDSVYGSEQIDDLMKRVNKVSDDYWPTLLKERGMPETTKGFVDHNSNLYLPESANEHSAYHELFHQLSEINGNNNGLKYTDMNGNLRKVTGIREFYSDGFNSTWANETLTDFLASKYSDGKIYESIYSKENVKLWSRLDDAMSTVYGDAGSNLLINAYLSNDTTNIRNFFDTYSKSGSYDDFVRTMQNFDTKSLDNMVSRIEKEVYKQNNSFGSKIKSIFGGK